MTTKRPHRTWPQRLTFGFVLLASLACFATAAGLTTGHWVLSQRQLIELGAPASDPGIDRQAATDVIVPGGTTTTTEPVTAAEGSAPSITVALAEPDAANFLVVGADNNACVGEGISEGRGDIGERSDTIMVWRANPATNQLAVLSLPRDLYVDIAGGRKARINSAFRRDDPSKLIATIDANFGIPIDHYVQVDFCAFEQLVDAVGGVQVPFEFPARDTNSGLSVLETGCVNLEGPMALAYVRSRHYQYEDPPGSGNWVTDGTSDFGRIARQQDFLRRVVSKVISQGLYSPDVAGALITTNRDYLTTDAGLTVRRMLEFANTLRRLDPAEITTYRIESSAEVNSAGEQVERPRIGGDNMQAILAVFRGEATLASAPDQQFDPENTTGTTPSSANSTTTVVSDGGTSTSAVGSDGAVTLPSVEATENVVGQAPDRTVQCDR